MLQTLQLFSYVVVVLHQQAVNTAMTALIKATSTFVTEKLIVQRERRTQSYPATPYFLAKLLAEAPLAAIFPCLSGAIMYALCGLNPTPGRLLKFLGILTIVSLVYQTFFCYIFLFPPDIHITNLCFDF